MKMKFNMRINVLSVLLVITLFYGSIASATTGDHEIDIYSCCSQVFGSCRVACENLSLVQIAAAEPYLRESKLNDIKRLCPVIQTDFWICINRTLHAIVRGSEWPGRSCCKFAISPKCQNACATSISHTELKSSCRQSDEQTMYSCFERKIQGDDCCSNARTNQCLQACREVIRNHSTPTKEQRINLDDFCNNNSNAQVLQCIQSMIELTPVTNSKQYLPCCEYSPYTECRDTCKNVLTTQDTFQEIIENLEIGGCGPPLPFDPLWQCFLSPDKRIILPDHAYEVSQINQLGMDSAKLHCCIKAVAPKCKKLCIQTFTNEWTSTRNDFEMDCYNEVTENMLKQCIDDVDEPCELGCTGLSFCSNFNTRPTELFRSCNNIADDAARQDVDIWKLNGHLSLPGIKLPIKNITKCSPDIWRAVACTLQIKPCTKNTHSTQICREDCYNILTKCLDWTRLNNGITANYICGKLTADNGNSPCISLKNFLNPSDLNYQDSDQVIVSPCRGHPCNATDVCQVDGASSNGYRCIQGCPLGETSSYFVSFGSYVRIPVSTKQKGCLKICRCSLNGRMENCQPLPCINYDSCKLSGKRIEHGSSFYIECNLCTCYAGEITCTRKQCKIDGITDKIYTSLPCGCPAHHLPVCGRNGNTYPSACIAKCNGLHDSDIEFGPCRIKDQCNGVMCPNKMQCIEDRQVCLSTMHRPCTQYRCVNNSLPCENGMPVCDTNGDTHESLCQLNRLGKELAFIGECLYECSSSMKTPVCGFNGVTYLSECEAWSDFSSVDYKGHCNEVGLMAPGMGSRCSRIKCETLPTDKCSRIIPPGACCPICGGGIRIMYSRKQIDRALYALKTKNSELVTLKAILRSLGKIIKTSRCRLSGYLTIETDLFVAVEPIDHAISDILIEVCLREAEKITTLIATQNHRISTDLALSALTMAKMIPASAESNGFIVMPMSLVFIMLIQCIQLNFI